MPLTYRLLAKGRNAMQVQSTGGHARGLPDCDSWLGIKQKEKYKPLRAHTKASVAAPWHGPIENLETSLGQNYQSDETDL